MFCNGPIRHPSPRQLHNWASLICAPEHFRPSRLVSLRPARFVACWASDSVFDADGVILREIDSPTLRRKVKDRLMLHAGAVDAGVGHDVGAVPFNADIADVPGDLHFLLLAWPARAKAAFHGIRSP